MARFTLSANTLSKTVKDNPADRIEVEIGDSKQLDFKPQFKVSRWDNEVNFSMRAQEEAGATMVEEDGKIKYKGRDIEVHQYEKPDAGDDGGFEFEWVLNKKPESNVLRTTIQHKGLDFFYQPEITDEEALASMFDGDKRTLEEIKREMRPENVVGSYAVYHKTNRDNIVGGMEYKSGKAFHIYRPHAVDADGVKVWCGLDIKEGELTVTVPEDFLNKASYPVVVDPTFGFTTSGASFGELYNSSDGTHYGLSTRFTLTENGDLDSLSGYFSVSSGRIGGAKMMVYSNGSGVPNARQAYTTQVTFTSATSELETNTPISSLSLTAGDLWLAVTGTITNESGSGQASSIKFDTGGDDHSRDASMNYTTPDATWTESSSGTNKYSIYATYTASSSFNPAFAHRRLLVGM